MPISHSPSRRAPRRGVALGPAEALRPRRRRPRRGGARRTARRDVGSARARCAAAARSGRCPCSCASSSIALSSANVPTDSPGARMKVLATMSSVGHLLRDVEASGGIEVAGREGELLGAVVVRRSSPATPVWISASSLPSLSAPSATRCSVGVRPPTRRKTPSRDSASRTGRPASFAAAAARIWWFHRPCRRTRRRRRARARAPARPGCRTPRPSVQRCE